MEIKTTDIILICLLISLIGVVIVAIVTLDREGVKCMQSPIVYGLKDTPENISCYCNYDYKINKEGLFKRTQGFVEG